ncbi:MAG TPA: hypothetical protein VF171_04010 [Trueperaceae bacterium]
MSPPRVHARSDLQAFEAATARELSGPAQRTMKPPALRAECGPHQVRRSPGSGLTPGTAEDLTNFPLGLGAGQRELRFKSGDPALEALEPGLNLPSELMAGGQKSASCSASPASAPKARPFSRPSWPC